MLQETSISERRACALVGLARDSWRHPPQRAQADQGMSQRIVELAHERRRFGYRRIGDLIRADGTVINDKRVYRLYRLADLAVRKRRSRKRLKLERVPLHRCEAVNEVWSLDFVSDCLANGRRIKCLTISDDFSHECVDIVCVRPSHLDPGHETVVSGQAAGDQRCGSSSSIRLAGCVGSRSSTSLKYA